MTPRVILFRSLVGSSRPEVDPPLSPVGGLFLAPQPRNPRCHLTKMTGNH